MFSKKNHQFSNNTGQRYNQGYGPQGPGPQGQYQNQYNQNQYFQQNPFDQQDPYQPNQNNMSSMYPNMQFERLQYDIKENRRRINNLTKRIIRLENYLRIRDTSDYVNIDEDIPNEYSV